MAIFSITTSEQQNNPPNSTGAVSIQLEEGEKIYIINIDDVTTKTNPPYEDPENDPLRSIKITSISSDNKGIWLYDGVEISVDDEIPADDIINGLFTYEGVDDIDEYSDMFTFHVSDTGSEQFADLTGTFQITLYPDRNLPPTVGDVHKDIGYGESLVFTSSMFIDDPIPPYDDPEGDAPYQLRIDSLPEEGLLIFDDDPVNIGDIFNFSEIDLGKLIYIPDTDIKDNQNIEFEFSVSDIGSGEFSN